MTRLAEFVLRHRLLVVLFWLAAMMAGGATAATTTDRLSFDFSLPGQQGFETEKQLLERYGNGPDEGTTIVTVTVPDGSTVEQEQAQVDGVYSAIQSQFPQYRVVWSGNTGSDAFTTEDGRTAYGIVVDERFTGFEFQSAWKATEPLLAEQEQATGFDIGTTGYFQLSEGNTSETEGAEPPARSSSWSSSSRRSSRSCPSSSQRSRSSRPSCACSPRPT